MGTVFFSFIFFRTYLQPYERLYQLFHVLRATTPTTICSFSAKCAATGGKRSLKMSLVLKSQSIFKP